MLAQRRAVGVAVQRPLAQHVEGAPSHPQPPHAVVDTAGIQALLSDQEPRALGAEQGRARDPDVLVADLGVVAVAPEALVGVLHRGDVADDVHAGGVGFHDEHRGALVRTRIGVGDRHHDQEVGDRAVGGEPLVAVDHPVVAVAHRAGLEQRRVRAGGVGLGHGEAGLQVAGQQRVQVTVLLLRGPGHRQDLGVARVRRGVAEHERRDRAGAEDLVHQTELDLPETLTAELGIQVRGPQALLLDLLLKGLGGAAQPLPAELVEQRLQRPHLLAHEAAHPLELGLELGFCGEIPGHRRVDSHATARSYLRVGLVLGVSLLTSRDLASAAPRPPHLDRRIVPASGGARVAHAHRRRADLRRPGAGVRGLPRPRPRPAAPGAALPPEARHAAAGDRPAAVGRRSGLQPRVPRAPHGAAPAGHRGAAVPAGLADRLPAAGPLQAAVGELAGRGPRGRPLRAHLQDPPRAGRRHLRRRPGVGAVRRRARARCRRDRSRAVAPRARAVLRRAGPGRRARRGHHHGVTDHAHGRRRHPAGDLAAAGPRRAWRASASWSGPG